MIACFKIDISSYLPMHFKRVYSNLPKACKVYFQDKDLGPVSPLNLGAGMSYVSKVIILCLIAKKGDLVIIENPEIHLHPQAQAQLGVFFTFIANCGIQLIIETHCEHLINKICYQVYDEKIAESDVVIQYKANVREQFQQLKSKGLI